MFWLAIGGPGSGKSHLVREWLLPTLLADPTEITSLAPSTGFRVALIHDPSRGVTGPQFPGQRFEDVAHFRRTPEREFLCCFERPNPEELMKLAKDCVGALIVFDEVAKAFPATGRLSEIQDLVTTEGRHYAIGVIGCALKLHKVHADVRNAAQGLFLGNLAEPHDREYAEEMIGRRGLLNNLNLRPRQFVQWNRETGNISLIHIDNGRRVVEQTLQ